MAGRARVIRGGEPRPGPGREIGLRVCLKPSVLRRLAPSRHVHSSPLRSHRSLGAPIFLHGRTHHLHSFPLSSRTPDLGPIWLSLSVFGTPAVYLMFGMYVCTPDVFRMCRASETASPHLWSSLLVRRSSISSALVGAWGFPAFPGANKGFQDWWNGARLFFPPSTRSSDMARLLQCSRVLVPGLMQIEQWAPA